MAQPVSFGQVGRIIQYAMRNAYILEDGQEPNSEQLAEGLNRLNDLANFEQTQGLKLWLQQDLPIPLFAGQFLYPLTGTYGKPLRIPRDLSYMLYVAGLPTSTPKVPVITLSQQEWVLLSNTGSTPGMVSQIYVDKQLAVLNVNTYLVPDSTTATNYVLHVILQQQLVPGMQITDQTQFPLEWYVGLQWLLAEEMCTGKPQNIVARCQQKAAFYRETLEAWDVEDAQTFFVPDNRMGTRQNRFS